VASPRVLDGIVRYVYGQPLAGNWPADDLVDLAATADEYLLDDLKDEVDARLAASLTADNLVPLYGAADPLRLERTVRAAATTLLRELPAVVASDAFVVLQAQHQGTSVAAFVAGVLRRRKLFFQSSRTDDSEGETTMISFKEDSSSSSASSASSSERRSSVGRLFCR